LSLCILLKADFEDYLSNLTQKNEFEISELQNPFFNPNLEQIHNLKIQAIFPNKVRINGLWYAQNDTIGALKIKAISFDEISFEFDGRIIALKPFQNDKILIR